MLTPSDLRKLLIELDDFLNRGGVDELSLEECLEHLVAANQLKRDIADIYDVFSAKMIDRMNSEGKTDVTLDSGTELKCKTGSARKSWDSKALMSQVYDRLQQSSVDMDTGEVVLSTQEIFVKLLDYLQPSYWRVGALSELGINADHYCEVGEAKTNIAVYTKGEK